MTFAKILAVATLFAIGTSVSARDLHKMLPIKDALEAPAAQEKLDKKVRLYFVGQPHPRVEHKIGEWSTNKKTNSVGKSVEAACNWAFLSAMLSLQERARGEGGNAVIDIKSNYKGIETDSATEFMCGDGAIVSGVAFKGTVVKLAN
jgi:uncharacterized protein YbjQ (UPF0145 family)